MREASCSCGQLVVRACGEPLRVSVCHCFACQKRSGSVFAVQARFPEDALTIAGESREYVRVGDSGGAARFHFCPTCGDTVYYRPDATPDVVAIPVGAFADQAFPAPTVSNYEERRHAWVELTGPIVRND